MNETRYNPPLHWLAMLTTAATFPLIFIGGLVTSHGAGMSVPDWPNSYGYNMFTFPPSLWIGGVFYEHTHRLMGTLVGLGATLMLVVAWGWGEDPRTRRKLLVSGAIVAAMFIVSAFVPVLRRLHVFELLGFFAFLLVTAGLFRKPEPRRWVRWLTVVVLIGVIVQGVLGGLRVRLVELDLAIIHACIAQAYFCLVAFAAVVTGKWWINAPDLSQSSDRDSGRRLGIACLIAISLIAAQLIVGAMMRHYRAGLAVPDFPLAYGQILPRTDPASLNRINMQRVWTLHLDAVTPGQIWLHMAHRIGAVLVTISIAVLGWMVFRNHRFEWALRRPVVILLASLIVQVTLGALIIWWQKPADLASIHVAIGALTLVTVFVLTVRVARLYERRRDESGVSLDSEPDGKHRFLAA